MTKQIWKVHVVANCSDCGKEWDNYHNAQALAAKHAKATGHEVHGEVGLAFCYNRKQQEAEE